MKEKENLLKYLNKSQYDFIQCLNDFFPGIVFIISINESIFQFVDPQKVRAYGLVNNVFDINEFLNTYFHPKETEKIKTTLSKLVENLISSYSSILRTLNTKTRKWNFFYVTIKEIEMQKIQQGNFFLGVAHDIDKLDITKVPFNNLIEELDFFNKNKEKFDLLTKREKKILSCICECKTNFEISQELYICKSTVETHRKSRK